MPSPDDIANQQKLLAAHRQTLADYLHRQALQGEIHAPPEIANGIRLAREGIARAKTTLRAWEVPVDDLLDDTASNIAHNGRSDRLLVAPLLSTGSPPAVYTRKADTILREVIYQERSPVILSRFERLTQPLWAWYSWKSYCTALAAMLANEEGVEREFSELMARLSPGDTSLQIQGEVIKVSNLVNDRPVQRLMILGEPGSGKTTSLRHIAMLQARAAAKNMQRRLPIIAPLGTYTGSDITVFLQDKVLGIERSLVPLIPQYLQQGQLVILFDAVNELPGVEYERSIQQIRLFMETYPRCRYIFTGRSETYQGELGLVRAAILPLTNNLIEEFLTAYLPNEGKLIYNEVRNGRYLDLMRNPFFLWMVIKTGMPPGNKGQLIEQFVNAIFERDSAKRHMHHLYQPISSADLRQRLELLAYTMMHDHRTTVIARTEAELLLRQISREDPQEDAIAQGCETLLLRYQDDRHRNITFWHQIIQEYFTATYLERHVFTLSSSIIATFCSDPYWWETLVLLNDLVSDRKHYILSILGDGSEPLRVLLAAALTYASDDVDASLDQLILPKLLSTFLEAEPIAINNAVLGLVNVAGREFLLRIIQSPDIFYNLEPSQIMRLLSVITIGGGDDLVVALLALADLCWQKGINRTRMILRALQGMGQIIIRPIFEKLLAQEEGVADVDLLDLAYSIPTLRNEYIECLATMQSEIVDQMEILAKNASDRSRRYLAAEILIKTHSNPAIRLVCRWIEGKNDLLYQIIKRGLVIIDNYDVAFELGLEFGKSDSLRRLAIVNIMRNLKSPLAQQTLEVIAKSDRNSEIRELAAEAVSNTIDQSSSAIPTELSIFDNPEDPSPFRGLQQVLMGKPEGAETMAREIQAMFSALGKVLRELREDDRVSKEDSQSISEEFALIPHFMELKDRVKRCASVFWIAAIVLLLLSPITLPKISSFLQIDIQVSSENLRLILAISLAMAGLIALPVVIYQVLAFFLPALTPPEKRAVFLNLPRVVIILLLICLFATYLSKIIVKDIGLFVWGGGASLWLVNLLAMALVLSISSLAAWIYTRRILKDKSIYDTISIFIVLIFGNAASYFFEEDKISALHFSADSKVVKALLSRSAFPFMLKSALFLIVVPAPLLFSLVGAWIFIHFNLSNKLWVDVPVSFMRFPLYLVKTNSQTSNELQSKVRYFLSSLAKLRRMIILLPPLLLLLGLLFLQSFQKLSAQLYHISETLIYEDKTVEFYGNLQLIMQLSIFLLVPCLVVLIHWFIRPWVSLSVRKLPGQIFLSTATIPFVLSISSIFYSRTLDNNLPPLTRIDLAIAGGLLTTTILFSLVLQYILAIHHVDPVAGVFTRLLTILLVLLILFCPSWIFPLALTCGVWLIFTWMSFITKRVQKYGSVVWQDLA